MDSTFLRQEADAARTRALALLTEEHECGVDNCYNELKKRVDEYLETRKEELIKKARDQENYVTIWQKDYKPSFFGSLFNTFSYEKEKLEHKKVCKQMREAVDRINSYKGFSFNMKQMGMSVRVDLCW